MKHKIVLSAFLVASFAAVPMISFAETLNPITNIVVAVSEENLSNLEAATTKLEQAADAGDPAGMQAAQSQLDAATGQIEKAAE